GLLDQKSLDACSAVNDRWEFLARQVQEDQECRSTVQRDLLQLQELCPRKTIPNYAKRVDVQIPQLNDEGEVVEVTDKDKNKKRKSKTEDFSLHAAYQEVKTEKVELEERNVFCGSYKTCVLMEQSDSKRRIHYSGGELVAAATAKRKVRLLRVPGGKEVPLLLQGHAGLVRALCLSEEKGLLLSTSFDLSIRCWSIQSGACVRTLAGHYGTITCLDCHEEHVVSGAEDGVVKAVWSLKSGKCLRTLMHSSPVWAVRMDRTHVVSGGDRGLVKVWSAETGALIKTLERHQGPVLCLSFDQWHLVTGSSDGYALGWSMLGKFRRCLMAFFHPKAVLSLEFLYLRVVSGCADGHIRIFNFLTGTCLKVLEPSSSGDPVSSLYAAGNRMVINSPSRLVLLQFEDVAWDYSFPEDREVPRKERRSRKGKRPGGSAEQQRPQDKSLRPRQTPKGHGRPKSITLSFCFSDFPKLSYKPSAHCLQPSQHSDSAVVESRLCGKPPNPKRVALVLDTGDEAEQDAAPPAAEESEAALQHELPQRDPSCPLSLDKFLLAISSLQSSCGRAPASPSAELSAEAGGAQHRRPGKVPKVSQRPLQQQEEQAAQLQRARLHSHSLAMTEVSTPFETRMLRLKLQNSLHSPTVKSSIPAPCLVRPKLCGSPRERKTPGGRGKDTPGPNGGDQLMDLCTASLELIPATPGTAAQTRNEAARRIKPPRGDGSRRDSRFRLLTAEQEVREAAVAARHQAQHQAQQAKPTEGEERARRKAWLRKSRGLPVDSFTGEKKTPAPELGHNTFI
ncbi:FBW10 protein, partial [Notiomystis cincta]|nr:FBW10 protein [Notiomystis cincta]